MSVVDAVLNGVVFLALVVGLAIGWRRSPALRETLVELFLPALSRSKPTDEQLDHGFDHAEATWKVYVAHKKDRPSTAASDQDRETLSHLHALRA